MQLDNLILAEKYRPTTLDECILPEDTKKQIQAAIDSGNIPNLLMYGSAGTGKTTVARVIANMTNSELLYINASLERSIDVIRDRIMGFSSTISLMGQNKIVLCDEFDGMTSIAQSSMKSVTEQFPTVRFFFTSNHINKVIDPIKSRCVNIEFKIPQDEKTKVMGRFMKRVAFILDNEGIEYDKQTVASIINKYFPDFRRTLNEIQRYANTGSIDMGIMANQTKESLDSLFKALEDKNFTEMRKWVGQNPAVDPQALFRDIYDQMSERLEPQSIPQVVLILADYSFKATQSIDPEIVIVAALVEIMVAAVWK